MYYRNENCPDCALRNSHLRPKPFYDLNNRNNYEQENKLSFDLRRQSFNQKQNIGSNKSLFGNIPDKQSSYYEQSQQNKGSYYDARNENNFYRTSYYPQSQQNKNPYDRQQGFTSNQPSYYPSYYPQSQQNRNPYDRQQGFTSNQSSYYSPYQQNRNPYERQQGFAPFVPQMTSSNRDSFYDSSSKNSFYSQPSFNQSQNRNYYDSSYQQSSYYSPYQQNRNPFERQQGFAPFISQMTTPNQQPYYSQQQDYFRNSYYNQPSRSYQSQNYSSQNPFEMQLRYPQSSQREESSFRQSISFNEPSRENTKSEIPIQENNEQSLTEAQIDMFADRILRHLETPIPLNMLN